MRTEKHGFVKGLVPHKVFLDFLRGECFLLYPGAFGVRLFAVKPSQNIVLQGFCPTRPPLRYPLASCLLPFVWIGRLRTQVTRSVVELTKPCKKEASRGYSTPPG